MPKENQPEIMMTVLNLIKKFSYTKGACSLVFTLDVSNVNELKQYHEMLQAAYIDVGQTIIEVEKAKQQGINI